MCIRDRNKPFGLAWYNGDILTDARVSV